MDIEEIRDRRISITGRGCCPVHLGTPAIMGILNVTPDSFSDGGSYRTVREAVEMALEMEAQGADIIDVGGESTRPFAEEVRIEEEMERVLPVIETFVAEGGVPVSIDTRHVEVARAALDAGASIVNDVNSLRGEGMERLVVDRGVTAVLMHMKGSPRDMQVSPVYDDVMAEITGFLAARIDSFTSLGGERERLIIDPGIGFGKRLTDNLTILRDLAKLKCLGLPILVGASRKSFIGAISGTGPDDRLEGSIAAAVIAVMNGASVLRVHDVLETRRALDIVRGVSDPDALA